MSNAAEEHSNYGPRVWLFLLAIPVGITGLVLDGLNCGLVVQRMFGCNNIGAQLLGEATSQVVSQAGSIMIFIGVIMLVVSFLIRSKEGSGIEHYTSPP